MSPVYEEPKYALRIVTQTVRVMKPLKIEVVKKLIGPTSLFLLELENTHPTEVRPISFEVGGFWPTS